MSNEMINEVKEDMNQVANETGREMTDIERLEAEIKARQATIDDLNNRLESFTRDVDKYVQIKEAKITELEDKLETLMWMVREIKRHFEERAYVSNDK